MCRSKTSCISSARTCCRRTTISRAAERVPYG
jgi:hypothetical protein